MEVLRGRGAMLATIAGLLSFLPRVLQLAYLSFSGASAGAPSFGTAQAGAPGTVALIGLVSVVFGIVTLWGNLAIVAGASDPATDRGTAIAIGARRIGITIGLYFLIGLALLLLLIPLFAIVGASVLNLATLGRGGAPSFAPPGGGSVLVMFLYLLALFVVFVWVGARLSLLLAVIVNERRGIGSFARSFELTRGLTWRIIGVLLLFGIVFGVAFFAVQSVTGIVFRLLLGAQNIGTATFLAGVVSAAVSAVFALVSGTFFAQLYRATSGYDAAETFR